MEKLFVVVPGIHASLAFGDVLYPIAVTGYNFDAVIGNIATAASSSRA